jgi:hypothetical protein
VPSLVRVLLPFARDDARPQFAMPKAVIAPPPQTKHQSSGATLHSTVSNACTMSGPRAAQHRTAHHELVIERYRAVQHS